MINASAAIVARRKAVDRLGYPAASDAAKICDAASPPTSNPEKIHTLRRQ